MVNTWVCPQNKHEIYAHYLTHIHCTYAVHIPLSLTPPEQRHPCSLPPASPYPDTWLAQGRPSAQLLSVVGVKLVPTGLSTLDLRLVVVESKMALQAKDPDEPWYFHQFH